MASKVIVDNPLRVGGDFEEQDMEDLTSHLAGLPGGGGRSSHDGLDLGDNTELLQGNLDRFRALAGDDSNDDLFTSYGGLGLGVGLNDSTVIATTNYPTYGELAAAKPPSYEDSVLYERAPQGMHVGGHATAVPRGDDAQLVGSYGNPLGDTSATEGPSSSHPPLRGFGLLGTEPLMPPSLPQPMPTAPPSGSGSKAWPAAVHRAPPGPPGVGGALVDAAEPRLTLQGRAGGGSGIDLSLSPYAVANGGGGGSSSASATLKPSTAALTTDTLDSQALSTSAELRGEDLQGLYSPQLISQTVGAVARAGGSGGGGGSSGSSQSPHQLITVSEPIKREQSGIFGIKGGYVTYLVRSRLCGNGSTAPAGTSVRRRFREFVLLAELLKEKYRGYFVPPRPEKNAVEGQRMTDVFVEERRLALERYLNKLARHPVIGASEELRLFLEVDGELADCTTWLALRPSSLGGSVLEGTAKFSKQILGLDRAVTDPVQAAQPTKKAADFMRAIKETARSMQSGPSSSSLPPDEVALVRSREEVEALQGALTTAGRAAEKLVSRLNRWSMVHGELGMALLHLRNAERADGVALANHTGTLKQSGTLMHCTERLSTALIRSSRIGRKVTGRCAIDLSCLHEYLGLMPAALKGLRARDKACLTADTLISDLEGRRKAISELQVAGAKVLGGDAAKAKKVAELSGDVAVLEQSVVAARARYETMKEINLEEMGRLRSELRSDLLSALRRYAAIMSACSQRNLEIWLQAASELQATPEQLQAAKTCLVGAVALQPPPPTQQLTALQNQQQPALVLDPQYLAPYPQSPQSLPYQQYHQQQNRQFTVAAAAPSQFATAYSAGMASGLGEVDLHGSGGNRGDGGLVTTSRAGREGYPL